MNEFGETPSIYIWPKDHVEGQPFPDNFQEIFAAALDAAGIAWETT